MPPTTVSDIKVKPRTPTTTPEALFNLNALDSCFPYNWISACLLFKTAESRDSIIPLLTDSLQRLLDNHRMLAGRVGGFFSGRNGLRHIVLNDCGLPLQIACFDGPSADEIVKARSHPLPQDLFRDDLPSAFGPMPEGAAPAYCKITFIPGGVAISLSVTHAIWDAHSFWMFVEEWARLSRDGSAVVSDICDDHMLLQCDQKIKPCGDLYMIMPPIGEAPVNMGLLESDQLRTVVVEFTKDELAKLKEEALRSAESPSASRLSTNDALCAHLWRCIIRARGFSNEETTMFTVAVDGRSRFNPRLPEQLFSNCVFGPSSQKVTVGSLLSMSLGNAAMLIRASLSTLTSDSLRSACAFLQDEVAHAMPGTAIISRGFFSVINTANSGSSSWVSLMSGSYDFSFGEPSRISLPQNATLPGVFILIKSPEFDGIQAFITLNDKQLKSFLNDPAVHRLSEKTK